MQIKRLKARLGLARRSRPAYLLAMNQPSSRLDFPATGRNREAILGVLERLLPSHGAVLEVASGSGQHIAYFAERTAAQLPELIWQPSDLDPAHRASTAAWTTGLANVRPPLALDATETWSFGDHVNLAAILCQNMIHIAPWAAGLGLLANAGRALPAGGLLYLYGPFRIGGRHTADSNAAFDQSLRAQDPSWGVRNLDEVAETALNEGFQLAETVAMPANNLSVVFRRKA